MPPFAIKYWHTHAVEVELSKAEQMGAKKEEALAMQVPDANVMVFDVKVPAICGKLPDNNVVLCFPINMLPPTYMSP